MSNGGTPKNDLPTNGQDNHLVRGDGAYHDDKLLIAGLTAVNDQISRYVLRHLDADAGRAVPTKPDDEVALGKQIIRLGRAVQVRGERRRNS